MTATLSPGAVRARSHSAVPRTRSSNSANVALGPSGITTAGRSGVRAAASETSSWRRFTDALTSGTLPVGLQRAGAWFAEIGTSHGGTADYHEYTDIGGGHGEVRTAHPFLGRDRVGRRDGRTL